MKTFSITLAIILLPCFLYAQNTWEGDESTDWGDEDNWSDESVPTSSDYVTIPGGQSNYPVVDETAECLELTIGDGATLTVNTGADLTVIEALIVGEGSSGEFILNGGTVSVDEDFRSEAGCTVDINGGTLNIGKDWESDEEIAKGTIELSGGTINSADDVEFSDEDVTGTMEGTFQLTIGDDFTINDNGWATLTGGTITMTASKDGDCSLQSSNVDHDLAVYNLIINGSGNTFTLEADVDLEGSLTLTAGTFNVSFSNYSINLEGNWVNNGGTYTPQEGTVTLDGSSSQTIGGSSSTTFNNVTLNNSSGASLGINITVNGTLTLSSGDLNLNGKTLTLGTDATLSETAGNCIIGTSGTVTITKTLSSPSSINIGGLGAVITSGANLGSTVVTRGHAVQSGSGSPSIKRYYDITPTNNSGLNATLVFNYDDTELNGLTESELVLFKSTDSGSTWTLEGGTVNTSNNNVTLSGISSFSRWTLGSSSSPLPVELISFTSLVKNNSVHLYWKTETEVDNYGFEIERKIPNQVGNNNRNWKKIGFVEGHGNSNSPKVYSFIDDNPVGSSIFYYRLKQVDNNGTFEYFPNAFGIEVSLGEVTEYVLEQNYPNPFNPRTTIRYSIPDDGFVKLTVYNLLGKEVATLVNNHLGEGSYEVEFNGAEYSSGVYVYRLESASLSVIKKMILLR